MIQVLIFLTRSHSNTFGWREMRLFKGYLVASAYGQGLTCPPDTNSKNQIPGFLLNDPYYQEPN